MAYDREYFEAAYGGFADPVFRRRWARACALMAGFGGLSCRAVLEFGAGLGQNLLELDAAEKWAVDISDESARACRGLGLEWRRSLAEVPDGRFDAIISHHSLEHTPDPHGVLLELRRKISADGRLFLAVPVESGAVPVDLEHIDLQRHFHSWIPNTLKNLCLDCGWRPLWIRRRCGRGLHRTLPLVDASPRLFMTLRDLADRFAPSPTGEITACCVPFR